MQNQNELYRRTTYGKNSVVEKPMEEKAPLRINFFHQLTS